MTAIEQQKAEQLNEFLQELFDDLSLATRERWAERLNVSQAALSYWVKGTYVPKPEHLNMIVCAVKNDDRIPEEWLQQFENMLQQPLPDVVTSPSKPMGRTLRHYMLRPIYDATFKLLATLPAEKQEKILYKMGEECRKEM